MSSRTVAWILLATVAGGATLVAAQPPDLPVRPLPPPLDRESDVREPVFRDLLKVGPPNTPRFLSFGSTDGKDVDPPADFFKSLADLKLPLKKASESEREPKTDRVRDKKTKEAGVLYVVTISKKVSDDELVLDASWVRGRRFGGGYSVRMVKDGKRWIPKEVLETWAY